MKLGIKTTALRRLFGATLVTLATAQTAAPPSDWPEFTFAGRITDKEKLKYNPVNEFIFPSIFHAGEHLDKPLGEWYLYYAPHDDPGGICLMHADDLDGPWTEYENNPIIKNKWDGEYSVPHVSSPEAIWNDESDRLFVYFHGSNAVTRWAETEDGVNFIDTEEAVTNKMGGSKVTETSYARVFKHPDSSSKYTYAMFYMGNEKDDIRRIRLAESIDGKDWVVDPDYVVTPGPEEGKNVSGGNLWEWKGKLYVIYHGSNGKIYARTIDRTLRHVGSKPILLHEASGKGVDRGRVAAPEIVTYQEKTYLFYESGDRLGGTIAYATAEASEEEGDGVSARATKGATKGAGKGAGKGADESSSGLCQKQPAVSLLVLFLMVMYF